MIIQLYDALLGWDQNHTWSTCSPSRRNANGTKHTVKLKSGLLFHNGKSVTADDVVYSFQRILNPKTVATGASSLAGLKATGIKKIDDLTVTFELDSPNVDLLRIARLLPERDRAGRLRSRA